MRLDLRGKLHHTVLPKSKPLLPLLEAIVNSFDAIEDRQSNRRVYIRIEARREPLLEAGIGTIHTFVINDNGVGFNMANYESFQTSDSLMKLIAAEKVSVGSYG